jgi:predicted ABC-type ATPase
LQQPTFYLLAGPNGAGKSTLFQALVANGDIPLDCEFVNADVYERAHLRRVKNARTRSERARQWADGRRSELLTEGHSFASETVFSHESKLALIQQAQSAGFQVVLLVVALDKPERLLARVAQRVTEGGHSVPTEKILERYPRSLALLKIAVRQADLALLYDTHDVQPGTHALVALCEGAHTEWLVKKPPVWARQMLEG